MLRQTAYLILSVSPMHLLITIDRSILKKSKFNSFAIISAAIVLPVPLSPAKSAVIPNLY
jgi:hypothetical protein